MYNPIMQLGRVKVCGGGSNSIRDAFGLNSYIMALLKYSNKLKRLTQTTPIESSLDIKIARSRQRNEMFLRCDAISS